MRVYEAKTLLEKAKGLLGTKNPYPLLLRTRFGIHTFGMNYAIDVCVLNHDHHIVKLKSSLQPNRIFLWDTRYDLVLELPEKTIQRMELNVGDSLPLELE